ncbi:uncharacterized protein LAESUDRAFT_645564 [Laetiporus sulphureus 93-53]|uniref:Uncharacterized protein n=1 Tax=Laetiporus sulphureus 93-53 TaxID=1314785 RepID=A0A165G4R3_9APHY|nr:uncharacterized protein LAESUDRAFT_645564 [Laetiporus sulphureus 93-53]KZT09827.1 hypothetical protein LAESUDRAFT_645564 [Laetiporus sulphureus 93-53]
MLFVRALHTKGRLAFFSCSNLFALLNWETGMRWIIDIAELDEEEIWNGIIGAKFITHRHILCIKSHAVELLTLPCLQTNAECHAKSPSANMSCTSTDNHFRVQVIAHTFSQTTFRGSSFSAPTDLYVSGTDESLATVFFLAYDVLRGLFHYRVSLMLPPDSASNNLPPHMSVRLVAAHQMAMPISSAGSGARIPRSGFGPGARGFVSTCALGSTGRRGVWIERRRGSVRRGVVGFSALIELLEEEPESEKAPEQQAGDELLTAATGESDDEAEVDWWDSANCRAIEGSTIYEVNSYDLRDDITHCAFSEAAGRVVLGTRNGDIQYL